MFLKLKYNDTESAKENIKALFAWVNFAVREITEGRVKYAQSQIAESKETEALTLELAADHEARLCEIELGVN